MADEITEVKMRRTTNKFRSGKDSSVCGIQGKVLKAGGEITL